MLFLNAEDVTRSLPMPQAIEAMKNALAAIADNSIDVPVRHHLNVQPHDNTLLVMPAVIDPFDQPGFTVKVATVCPNNSQNKLPTVQSIVVAFDSQTGAAIAFLEGKAVTAIRTAATSAAATLALARVDSHTLAVFGAGVLARTHIEAMACVRDIRLVKIYSRSQSSADQLIEELRNKPGTKFDVQACENAHQALLGADIVCTVTSSKTPVFDPADVPEGVHINAVGAYTPAMAEVPAETVVNSRVFVEQLKTSIKEAGDLAIPIQAGLIDENHIAGEIGAVIAGQIDGRTSNDQITLFKSVGNAGEDAFAVQTAVKCATEMGIGRTVQW